MPCEWLLIGGSSLIFRAYYGALPSARGSRTDANAVGGFLDRLARPVADHRLRQLVIADDWAWRPQWRVDLIPTTSRIRPATAGADADDRDTPTFGLAAANTRGRGPRRRKPSDAGLLRETIEQGARKRRTYELTDAGQAALEAWFFEPEGDRREARDPGLLKLFFADLAGEHDQAAGREPSPGPTVPVRVSSSPGRQLSSQAGRRLLATLELGVRHTDTFAEFWEQLADGSEAE
jgi:PadR family transcriptional regulator AphA